ncbi:MAG: hypothetical protein MUC31_08775 [Bacteroidales bacterium]|jgi:hypothetical protein|nr:hypothetical protein [Bacteroidales bacterium]
MFLALTFEVLKFLLPAIVLYFTVRLITQAYLQNEEKKRNETRSMTGNQTTLPLRLQAYERLILLLERITPPQAINRVMQPGMTVYQLQVKLVQNIREEYEHNVAQQIYVSPAGWAMVKSAREEVIRLINTTATEIDAGSGAGDLAKSLLENWGQMDQNPVQLAIDQLKAEVRQVY